MNPQALKKIVDAHNEETEFQQKLAVAMAEGMEKEGFWQIPARMAARGLIGTGKRLGLNFLRKGGQRLGKFVRQNPMSGVQQNIAGRGGVTAARAQGYQSAAARGVAPGQAAVNAGDRYMQRIGLGEASKNIGRHYMKNPGQFAGATWSGTKRVAKNPFAQGIGGVAAYDAMFGGSSAAAAPTAAGISGGGANMQTMLGPGGRYQTYQPNLSPRVNYSPRDYGNSDYHFGLSPDRPPTSADIPDNFNGSVNPASRSWYQNLGSHVGGYFNPWNYGDDAANKRTRDWYEANRSTLGWLPFSGVSDEDAAFYQNKMRPDLAAATQRRLEDERGEKLRKAYQTIRESRQ